MSRLDLDELNRPQREAVTTTEGPLLVLAGAGSGKTRVITYRVAHLLERGASPDEVLAVSFTNKAADEMRERVTALVGDRVAKRLTLSTFHALGLMMLKREKTALGFPTGFTVYDTADQLGVVREILRYIKIDDRRFDAKAILHRISRWKNAFVSVDDPPEARGEYDEITRLVYPQYERDMNNFHALDFDDLVVRPVRLLDTHEGARERWQKRYRYLMIDEYQDTNRAQLLLVRHLAALHNNVCVVGDDDQSIYAWRGAESGNILEFEKHFPGAKTVTLEENYRSTPMILDAANAVIANNRKRHAKTLFTTRPTGEKLQLVVAPDPDTEAKFVAEEIDHLRARRGFKFGDCAVLYRSNLQSRELEEALRAQRILYRMIGGQAFYERKEVKDAIAYLKLILSPRDEISLRRIVNYPTRGIGDVTLDRLAQFAAAHNTTLWNALVRAEENEALGTAARRHVADFVAVVEEMRPTVERARDLAGVTRGFMEKVGVYDDLKAGSTSASAAQRRIDNLEGFLRSLDNFEKRAIESGGPDARPRLADYLHRLTLAAQDDDDDGDEKADLVTLVTLHGAKGLEFPVVFLVGVEEELLPHFRTLYPKATDVSDDAAAAADISEERRLMYVGITRARQLLYLSYTRARDRNRGARSPSRFLDEIPKDLLERRDLEVPVLKDAADEEAFARETLAKLRGMFGKGA